MLSLGQTQDDYRLLLDTLRGSHRRSTRVVCLDTSHNYLGDLTGAFIDGGVDVDTGSDITRSAKFTFADPGHRIQLASSNPDGGALYASRMIQAVVWIGTSDNSRWWGIPVFTGPVDSAARSGKTLEVNCLGKESLAMSAIWNARSYIPYWGKVPLLEDILRTQAGETLFNLQYDSATTTGEPTIVSRAEGSASPWSWAKDLASSMGKQLFYNAWGVATLRDRPGVALAHFDDSWTVGDVKVGFSMDDVFNAVEATGATDDLFVRHVAADWHPLSPQALGRNGVPRYMPKVVSNTDIRDQVELSNWAFDLLYDNLLQSTDGQFSTLAMPLLEEDDLYSLSVRGSVIQARAREFSIPLAGDPLMSIGYTKRVKPTQLARRLIR